MARLEPTAPSSHAGLRARFRRAWLIAVVPALAATMIAASGATAAPRDLQRVTLIGDSVAAGIPGDTTALATLQQGIDLQLQIAPCRRVAGGSCPYGGVSPPTVVDLAQQLGPQLGQTVIVEVGYNDFADQFAAEVPQALHALEAVGVAHVVWVTLHESSQQAQYAGMNGVLRAAAASDPRLTLADWNAVSQGQVDWLQSDDVHLYGEGARALAMLLHSTLVALGVAPPPLAVTTQTVPRAHLHASYAVKLTATGGLAPYRWSCTPALPRGLHLLATGDLVGRPTGRSQTATVTLTVRAADGETAMRVLVLRIV